MSWDGDDTCALRERLILAAMGIAAAGCGSSGEPSVPAPGEASATATAVATTELVIAPGASAAPVESLVAPPPEPTVSAVASAKASGKPKPDPPRRPSNCQGGRASKEQCFAPFGSMRSIGTGGPAAAPPREAFDSNGCLSFDQVSNGCCNGASAGPRFAGGQCCYEFCEGPCCGRAFMVDGSMRVAAPASGGGWLTASLASDDDLAVEARRLAAAGWLRDAQLEHASIASFSRFVLELLAVGAPASLVREAGQAMLDEVRHAELCFGLASRFGGATVGPAPLSMEGALTARSLPEIAAAAAVEGCVGETIAALTATRQLARAIDPEVRGALERIASDEARHAELAFRFVRWALDTGGEATRSCVARAFDEALRCVHCTEYADPLAVGQLHALGRLTVREQDEIAATAKRAVLGPAVEILMTQRFLN